MYIRWKHFESREKVLYLIGHDEERPMGWYEHIRVITKAEGREIIKAWREASYERMYRNTPIPDQIRAFLRAEAINRRAATCEPTLICADAGETDCSEPPAENMLATV